MWWAAGRPVQKDRESNAKGRGTRVNRQNGAIFVLRATQWQWEVYIDCGRCRAECAQRRAQLASLAPPVARKGGQRTPLSLASCRCRCSSASLAACAALMSPAASRARSRRYRQSLGRGAASGCHSSCCSSSSVQYLRGRQPRGRCRRGGAQGRGAGRCGGGCTRQTAVMPRCGMVQAAPSGGPCFTAPRQGAVPSAGLLRCPLPSHPTCPAPSPGATASCQCSAQSQRAAPLPLPPPATTCCAAPGSGCPGSSASTSCCCCCRCACCAQPWPRQAPARHCCRCCSCLHGPGRRWQVGRPVAMRAWRPQLARGSGRACR